MKFKVTETAREAITVYTISGILIATVCFLFRNISWVTGILQVFIKAIAPFIVGFGLAFVLLPLRNVIEDVVLGRINIKPRVKRVISTVSCIVFFFAIIATFFVILIPQLADSFQMLANSIGMYVRAIEKFLSQFNLEELVPIEDIAETLSGNMKNIIDNLTNSSTRILKETLNYSITLVTGVLDFLVGIIVAFYFLLDQERFKNQAKSILDTVFTRKQAASLLEFGRVTSRMFNSFIFGKALDSLIIGIITWIGMVILRMPYAALLGFIVGLTNMIPVFGPFIGAVPGAFILFFVSPLKAGIFLIFIVVLQQIDGNIIGPNILGNSVGLPPIWIMFAIFVGGSLFGVMGMFFGVPIFSVIYYEIRNWVYERQRLKSREG